MLREDTVNQINKVPAHVEQDCVISKKKNPGYICTDFVQKEAQQTGNTGCSGGEQARSRDTDGRETSRILTHGCVTYLKVIHF